MSQAEKNYLDAAARLIREKGIYKAAPTGRNERLLLLALRMYDEAKAELTK